MKLLRQLASISYRGWSGTGEGSVLIEFGNTHVLCVASFTEACRVEPPSCKGWVTSEYSMLPCHRNAFLPQSVRQGRRPHSEEISHLVAAPRSIVGVSALGETPSSWAATSCAPNGGTPCGDHGVRGLATR